MTNLYQPDTVATALHANGIEQAIKVDIRAERPGRDDALDAPAARDLPMRALTGPVIS